MECADTCNSCASCKAFVDNLRQKSQDFFTAENQQLLANIFEEALADRLTEEDAFTPPNPDMQYVSKLRALFSEEQMLRERRRARFCDKAFVPGCAGPDFPRSWTSNFRVEHAGHAKTGLKANLVPLALNTSFKKVVLNDVLPTAVPEFDRTAEDGTSFRIYRMGSVEVRTIQEPSSSEAVVAAFSLRQTAWQASSSGAQAAEGERLVKAKMYVEAIDGIGDLTNRIEGESDDLQAPWQSQRQEHCHYYVVLETNSGNVAVTEKCADGSITMVINPENLEDRNSLARLLYTTECREGSVSMREIKVFQASSQRQTAHGASPSDRKLYAKNLFKLASGKARLVRKSEKGAGKGVPQRREALGAAAVGPRRTYSRTVNYGQP